MAAQGSYSVTIRAVDQVTATVDKINKRMQAFQAPYERMSKSMSKLADVTGLKRVGKAFEEIGTAAGKAFTSISRVVEPLGIITAAATIAGLYRLATSWGDWGGKITFSAKQLGMSASRLNDWENAARLAGVSAQELDQNFSAIYNNLLEAQRNPGSDAAIYFQQIGLHAKDLQGTLEQVMPRIIDAMGKLEKRDPRLAKRVIEGMGGSEGILRFFRDGTRGTEEYLKRAIKYGHVTDEQIKKADAFRESQTALSESFERLGTVIGGTLGPVLQPAIEALSNFLADHQAQIAERIGEAVKFISDSLKQVDWNGLKTDAEEWYKRLHRVADMFGGVNTALKLLLGTLAAGALIKLLSPFFMLAGALDGAIAGMGRFVIATRGLQAAKAAATAARVAAGGVAVAEAGGAVAAAEAGGAAAALLGAGGIVMPLLIGAAVTATIAYLLAHGLSWLAGSGVNAAAPTAPTPNSANRGGAAQAARGGIATGPQFKRTARDDISYLMGLGWSRAQANIIEGNLAQESSLDAGAQNGTSRGLASWTAGSGRQDIFKQVEHADITAKTRQQQLDFINYELHHNYKAAGDFLHAQTATTSANTVEFGRRYLGFGTEGNRGTYGEQFNALQIDPPAAAAPAQPASVTVHVKADPGLRAKVTGTTGDVHATPPQVARTSAAMDFAH